MKLSWKVFGGETPRLEPHLLPENGSQLARNVKLYSGGLRPQKKPLVATDPPSPGPSSPKNGLYRYDDATVPRWLWSAFETDFTRGPNARDGFHRVYWSQRGGANGVLGIGEINAQPVFDAIEDYPNVPIGVTEGGPTAPTVVVGGAETGVGVEVTVAFAYVDNTGAVGALSAACTPFTLYPGQTLALSAMPTLTAATGMFIGPVWRNIYVGITDADGVAQFRYWTNHPCSSATLAATAIDLETLGEAAPDPSPLPCPAGVFGLGVHPNGFMFGFDIDRNEVCRSDVFKPFAWPEAYRDPLRDEIVGGHILGQSIVVCTKGRTTLFIGQDPLNMTKIDLDGFQPCVSHRTIRAVTSGVVYASPDGLVLVTGNAPLIVVTAPFFTREEWQLLNPSTMHAAVHDDRIYLFYRGQTSSGCLVLEFEGNSVRSVVRSGENAESTFVSPVDDTLYYSRSLIPYSQELPEFWQNYVCAWDRGAAPLTMTWRSRKVILDTRTVVGAARILSLDFPEGETAIFRFWGDGVLIVERTVTTDKPFAIPCKRRLKEFYWEVESIAQIQQVDVADTIGAFQRG